jgi:hypothetical protein
MAVMDSRERIAPQGAAVDATATDRREHQRKAGLWSARLDTGTGSFACVVLNLSRGGAMLQVEAPIDPRQAVTLVIERFGRLRAEVVWRVKEKNKIGLRFTDEPEKMARVLGDLPLI